MQMKKIPVHFNLEILLWQLGFCLPYWEVCSYSQDFSNLLKLAYSVSQPLEGPDGRAQGKISHTTSPLLGSVWEAKCSLRDKAFQGTHILRDTQMVPLKIWMGHSSQFHNEFLSEQHCPSCRLSECRKCLGQKHLHKLTQKRKHTQHSSSVKHMLRYFFFWY